MHTQCTGVGQGLNPCGDAITAVSACSGVRMGSTCEKHGNEVAF